MKLNVIPITVVLFVTVALLGCQPESTPARPERPQASGTANQAARAPKPAPTPTPAPRPGTVVLDQAIEPATGPRDLPAPLRRFNRSNTSTAETSIIDTVTAHSGQGSLKLQTSAGTWQVVSQDISKSLQPGRDYRVEIWSKASGGEALVWIQNYAGGQSSTLGSSKSSASIWTRQTAEFTAPAAGSQTVVTLTVGPPAAANAQAWFDDLKLLELAP